MTSDAAAPAASASFSDQAARLREGARAAWRKRWVRWLAILLSIPVILYFVLWLLFARGLPSAETLLTYQPPLPTTVRDVNGEPVQSFARERRGARGYAEIPQQIG